MGNKFDNKETTAYPAEVLIFGTMGNIGPEVRSQLASHGLHVAAVPFPQNVFNDEPGYRRTLVRAIARHRPEVVFPVGNPLAMSRFKNLMEQNVPLGEILNSRKVVPVWEEAIKNARLVVENEATIRLLDSKVRFCGLAKKLGLRQPEVYGRIEDIPENMQVVFKRDISFGGHGVHLPRNPESLQNLIDHQSPGEPYLIERFIEGQDYSLDTVRIHGNFASGGYRSLSAKGNGPSECREILPEGDRLLEEMRICAKTTLNDLDYQGVCGFDFRADISGNLYLLECNPRFTGGIASQAAAGFDIPWILYQFFQIAQNR